MGKKDQVQCRHSRTKTYIDPETNKFFAECEICDSVGPLRVDKDKALTALKSKVGYRDGNQGGYRKHAGRPKSVPSTTRTRGFEVDDKRMAKLRKWMKENGFDKQSPALRWIFDNLHRIKVPKRERAHI